MDRTARLAGEDVLLGVRNGHVLKPDSRESAIGALLDSNRGIARKRVGEVEIGEDDAASAVATRLRQLQSDWNCSTSV